MKKRKLFYTLFFLMLTVLILTHAPKSTSYAAKGLELWFEKMIPSLLPFMILSGIMVRLNLTESFASALHPFVSALWHVGKNVTYAMIMGFLCGFPMGARTVCELLSREKISEREAGFLLAFCNNIGPIYFTGFVLPLIGAKRILPCIFGMYGIPLVYGLILRYTLYRDIPFPSGRHKISVRSPKLLSCASQRDGYTLLGQIDDSVTSAVQGILSLGGYMILFNLLNLVPDCILSLIPRGILPEPVWKRLRLLPLLLAPILEITGGIGRLGKILPLYVLVLLPFGGLSCIAQTYSIIRHTGLSVHSYVRHKLVLTALTAAYYAALSLMSPAALF